jgi:hypothetical protein
VTTTGEGVDEDAYLLAVNDESPLAVDANETIDFDDVPVEVLSKVVDWT